MADKITDIIGQEAFAQVEKLKSELKQLNDAFENSAKVALLLNSALANVKGIKDTTRVIKDQQNALSEIQKLQERIAKQNTYQAQVEAELRIELQNATQANKDYAKGLQAKEGSINSLRLQLKALQNGYDAMSSAERESARGTDLIKHLKDVDAELKKLEAGSGRFQRNVGNYASGWSPLSNAIGQITRELPNFGQSLQIGVMSLTNNIGALQDAIKGINEENKVLKSEGKTTTSALSQIAGALFSWNTVLYVGIGLLSAYSKEIFAFVDNLFATQSSIDELIETQKDLNKAFEDSSVKEAVTNVNELRINIELAKEGFINKEQVVKQYNETIGKTTGLVSNIDEAEKQLARNADAYVEMTLYKTAANLAMEESAKQLLEAQKAESNVDSKDIGFYFASKEFEQEYENYLDTSFKAGKHMYQLMDKQEYANQKIVANAGKQLRQNAQTNLDIAKNLMKQSAQVAKEMSFNIFGDTKAPKEPKTPKPKAEPKEAEVNRINEIKKQYEREQKELDISLEKKTITEDDFYYKSLQKAKKFIANRQGLSKKEHESEIDFNLDLDKRATDYYNKLISNSMEELNFRDNYTKSLYKYFRTEKGLIADVSETEQKRFKEKYKFIQELADEDLKKGNEILKKAQDDTAKLIQDYETRKQAREDLLDKSIEATAEISRTVTDRLMADIERLAELQLQSVDAQEKAELASLDRLTLSENERAEKKKQIELEAEARRKEIEKQKIKDLRKFALIQKSVDVAEIISATALAIMRQLGNAIDQANGSAIPKAIAIGITGAVQLAKVLATPLPQYAEGIESTPTDSFAIVGEKGTELITEKSGKQYLTPNKDTLTYLPKGTKVTPHHELMANVYDNAHKYMASNSSVTTDTMQTALIQSFEELYNKVDNLTEIMAKKNMNVSIFGDYEHAMRIKKSRM
jgi:hypothetical protein